MFFQYTIVFISVFQFLKAYWRADTILISEKEVDTILSQLPAQDYPVVSDKARAFL